MGPFEMVPLIVLIVFGSGLLRYYMRHRLEANPNQSADVDALRRTVGSLEARVQTLEKLITDPARRLADEIDALKR